MASEKNCSLLATYTTNSRLFLAAVDISSWAAANQGQVMMQAYNTRLTCPFSRVVSLSCIFCLVSSRSVLGVCATTRWRVRASWSWFRVRGRNVKEVPSIRLLRCLRESKMVLLSSMAGTN